MNALVISAYPACGKSTYYNNNSRYANTKDGMKILDSDSSKFSWIYDSDGNKTNIRNPKFPKNYIKYIKQHLKSEDIIFVSSHEVVRKALYEAHIPFISIFPKDNIYNMKEWRARFLSRNNTLSFIEFQMEHWTEFINQMQEDPAPIKKVILDVHGEYPYINTNLIKYLLDDRR